MSEREKGYSENKVLEESVKEGYEEELSLEDRELRAKAAAVAYESLPLNKEGREILGEQISDSTIENLTHEIEQYDEERSYEAVRTLIGKLRENMQKRDEAWVPKNPEIQYRRLEQLISLFLEKVSRTAATQYKNIVNRRVAQELRETLPSQVSEHKEFYRRELDRLTEEYIASKKMVTESTTKLFDADNELLAFENARNEATRRIDDIRKDYAAAQQLGDKDRMHSLAEREGELLRDIATYEGAIENLSTKIVEYDQQITDYMSETKTIEVEKKLIGFMLHQFYGADRGIKRMAGQNQRKALQPPVIERDLSLLESVLKLTRKGTEANNNLTEIMESFPQYTPQINLHGATPEDIAGFNRSSHEDITKICTRAHETAQKYREVYAPQRD